MLNKKREKTTLSLPQKNIDAKKYSKCSEDELHIFIGEGLIHAKLRDEEITESVHFERRVNVRTNRPHIQQDNNNTNTKIKLSYDATIYNFSILVYIKSRKKARSLKEK